MVQSTRAYAFTGGRRTGDGIWAFTYDELGRLKTATSATEAKRIEYEWDPNDRITGRTLYQSDGAGGWTPATNGDGLPVEATFVWDPVADRLVTVFAKGASTKSDATAISGLVRQYLHGDRAYDDPIEVRIAETPGGDPRRYFPLIDHAGAGSLVATVGENGDTIERVLYADSYGDAPRYLHGAVVDRIALEAAKDASGNLQSVKVRVHLSERVVPSSVAGSLRVTSIKSDHSVAATHPSDPEVEDAHTLLWTLNASQWNTLVAASGGKSIEVAVRSTLRAEGWGNNPVQPLPAWVLAVYSGTATTPEMPVIKRDSIGDLTTFIDGIAANGTASRTLLSIANLYLAASAESKAKLLFDVKAWPLRDPGTQLVYARQRFFDTATGMFLQPDEERYRDSSSTYAGLAGNPIGNDDPTGTAIGGVTWNEFALTVGESLADAWNNPGTQGALQVLGGCGEATLGSIAIAKTGGVAIPGYIAVAHGSDLCGTGLLTLWSGEVQDTLTKQGVRAGLEFGGVSPERAELLSTYADIAVGATGTIGSTRSLLRVAGASTVPEMTWNEFRHINRGRFSRSALSAEWRKYKAGRPGEYLTSEPGLLRRALRVIAEDRPWKVVQRERSQALLTHRGFDWTFEHLFVKQRTIARHPWLAPFGNSYANTFLRIPRSLNARLGNSVRADIMFKTQVFGGITLSGVGGYMLGTEIWERASE